MTQTSTHQPDTDSRDPMLRVLLVGPASGQSLAIENTLRFSRKLMLVRARSCVDAIGELTFSPELDAHSDSSFTVVLLADDCVFDIDDSTTHITTRSARARQFAHAVSQVAPMAHIACAVSASVASTIATPVGIDSLVDSLEGMMFAIHADRPEQKQAASETVLHVDDAAGMHAEPKPGADQSRVSHALLAFLSGSADTAGSPATSVDTIVSSTGDEIMVQALMRGQSILKPALKLIEHRLGTGAVIYNASSQKNARGASVSVAGAIVGSLVASPKADAASVQQHAGWLGSWLAMEQSVEQMRHDSFVDPLTGAFNRRFFERELPRIIKEGSHHDRQIAILVFDIDNFKSFNDRFGHKAGDDILCQTVQLLRSVIRPSDRVCRIGGDEFVVVFYDPEGPRDISASQGMDNVRTLVDRLQTAIAEKQFPSLKLNAPRSLTISGGLASIPTDGTDPWKVLQIADARALDSKRSGKDTITFGPAQASR
ncbi:MAG: GGDEF domain-containing protein [Phycisphaeraceae bacterium]|nr:GGDEF domain-containing protein [Phycisphaerales bacterium]MCB9859013.1 GGDEF domain-containing protein [Phycisphaeraceae bacterium]